MLQFIASKFVVVQWLSCVWLFLTPWTVAHQAPLCMGFFKARIWSGLPFPSPGDLPRLGIEPMFPALAGGFFTTEPPAELIQVTYNLTFQEK